MELIHEIFYAVVCAEIFLCVQAQVTFNPDPEEDVQLQIIPLTPPVNLTTDECYTTAPIFKIQYATLEANAAVYTIALQTGIYEFRGTPIYDTACGHSGQQKYRVTLSNLAFIADPSLVGGTFTLKATLVNIGEISTSSKRTYTFPAPFNLTGSSVSALLNTSFTLICHVTSDYPTIEWIREIASQGYVGMLPNGSCGTSGQNESYIYNCQPSALTYTLTIPGSSLTKELQGSKWRCKNVTGEVLGSRFMKLDIVVPVTKVTISPDGSRTTLDTDEFKTVTFTCTTNDAHPTPTILWYIGSSDVTPQATGSKKTNITLKVTRTYHNESVKCVAWNIGNTGNLSDSLTLKVIFPPANNEKLEITGYTDGQVLYENIHAIISLSCTQPGGNPVVNMTFTCGTQTGTNGDTASEAIRQLNLTNDRNLNGQNCTCVSTHINHYRQSKSVSFIVYFSPSTPNISTGSPFPWKAPETNNLTCNTSPGNPDATTFIWKEGNDTLPTKSRTYSTDNLQPSDNGRQLHCQVSNNFTLHERVVLNSNVTTLRVEYDPVVLIEQSSIEVIEGHTAELRCSATGNPAPNVKWYRGSAPVTASFVSSSNYSIVNVNRTKTGTYTCKATAVSNGSNTLQPDEKNAYLRVLYPPTVSLYLQNTTENAVNHIIRCSATGDPNNASIVALQQRIGSTFTRNITTFTEYSPGNITLKIGPISYQDMGTYTCLASNGIPDRSNQTIQSDTTYLNVISSAKFETMQYIVRSDIDTHVVVRIPFYRNPPAAEDNVVWTRNTGASNETLVPSANLSFWLSDAAVNLKVHSVDVTLRGQSAIMNITSFQNYYEGNYTLQIRSNHADSSEVTVTLKRSGPPDTPSAFQLLTSTVSSVVLSWKKGSNGGYPQTFVILYKEKKAEVYNVQQIFDTTVNDTIKDEIEQLKSDTSYEFLLYSFNEKGNSSDHKTLEKRTLKEPSTSTPSSLNTGLVGGAAGGGAALLVIIAVLVVVLKRRRNKREDNDSKGILNNKEMSAGPSKQSDEDEDGLKDNPLYGSSLGGANDVQGASAAPGNPSLYADVVKPKKKTPAKESQDPPPIYAEVDKSKKKGKGLMKLKKQGPPRVGEDPPPIYAKVDKSNKQNGKQQKQKTTTGDVYEVLDGFKEKETQFNDPAGAQKNKEGGQRGYRNQDGLLYVDVKFDQPPPTGKPIIRGEERTGYAMIEFEEPPTYSTADDVQGAEGGE